MKYRILFFTGVITTTIAECFLIRNPNAYTLGALAVTIAFPLVSYFLILGIIAFVVGTIRKNVKKIWFPVLAWLFLVSGLLDVVGKSYVAFVLRPPTDKIIKELIVRGKTTRREGYTSFGICDKMRCYYNADGKCSIFRLDDVDRCTKP